MTSTLSTDKTGQWRTLRVSTKGGPEQLEQLLLTTVHPLVNSASASGGIEGWFVDRSGEAGSELRVGLLGAEDALVAQLGERIEAFLSDGSPDGATTSDVATGNGHRTTPAAVELPYEPEFDRYGGPHGLAVCEEQFVAASKVALGTLRTTRSQPKRLRAAGQLLLASVWATGADWRGAIEWLRGYAGAPPRDGALTVAEGARAQSTAEAVFFRNEAEWRRHSDQAREAVASPNSPLGGWYQQQARTWAALVELHEAGQLTERPSVVFRRLVERMNTLLGLSATDQVHLAWLMSMPLVTPGPREPWLADGPAAVDRQMHENSKFFPTRLEDQRPDLAGATSAGRQELPAPSKVIPLPKPTGQYPDAPRFEEVLLARRSSYGRYTGPMTLDELSALLYYSAAEAVVKTMPGSDVSYGVRPYPSGGTRYPIRLLMYCHDITGLERGIYLYEPEAHALALLSPGDFSTELQYIAVATDPRVNFAPKAGGGRIDATRCPLWIFPVADLTYQRMHYGLRSYRLVLVECGHVAQNLSLVITWLGKSCVGIGGYYDDAINHLLNVDGVNSAVLYVYLVGDVEPVNLTP
jgi:thiopeptide-type bacteriocin biosynthesis protein